jgi:transcriptional regulator with XRE-family HTH domain
MDSIILGRMPRARTYNADAVRFGAIVRELRQQRGWTRRKLATRSGMTPQYVAIVEDGGNVPSLSTVLELTEVLGADIGEIMRELAKARTEPAEGKSSR